MTTDTPAPLTEAEKDGIAKIAYFFRHTMKRMNVGGSALTAEDIANWNGASLATDKLCRDHGIDVCGDLK